MCQYTMRVCMVLLAVQIANAATRYVVPPETPEVMPTPNYTSWETAATNIQQAVDVASAGDLIFVTNGTYALTGPITIASAITLRSFKDGVTDRDGTVLDGGFPTATNRCVYVNNAAAVIDGFTITNGYAATNSLLGYGGGFYLNTKGVVTNCVVAGNQAESLGGGGYAYGACLIVDSLVLGNACWTNIPTYGGGLYVNYSIVSNCTIRGNTARRGGGVYMNNTCQLIDSKVLENTARILSSNDGGGGIWMNANGMIAKCNIISNKLVVVNGTAYNAGVNLGSGGTLRDSLLAYNTGAGYGGGVSAGTGRIVTNCVIRNNSASNGGGVYLSGGGLVTHCTIVSNNTAAFVQNGVLRNSLLANNGDGIWGESQGGGTYQNCTIVSNAGTGIRIGNSTYAITGIVENCIVYYNRVANYSKTAAAGIVFTNSCTYPVPAGAYDVGVVTNVPGFVNYLAGNYRLTGSSPCINKGLFRTWMTGAVDLEGAPRIIGKAVDMGAFESPPPRGTLLAVF